MDFTRRGFLKGVAAGVVAACSSGCPEAVEYLTLGEKVERAKKKTELKDARSAKENGFEVYDVGEEEYELKRGKQETNVKIWYPISKKTPSNLIYFSHGLLGSNTGNESVVRGLARRGNVVVARNYLDSVELENIGFLNESFSRGRIGRTVSGLVGILKDLQRIDEYTTSSEIFQEILANPELYNLEDWHEGIGGVFCEMFGYRMAETEELIDAIESRRIKLPVKINNKKPIVSGHSLGGWTAVEEVIEHPDKFGGLMCISPAIDETVCNGIKDFTIPSFYMTGAIDAFKINVEHIYGLANSPKVLAVLNEWGHASPSSSTLAWGVGIPSFRNGTFQDLLSSEKTIEQLIDVIVPLLALANDYPTQADNFQRNSIAANNLLGHFAEACATNSHHCWQALADMALNERLETCEVYL